MLTLDIKLYNITLLKMRTPSYAFHEKIQQILVFVICQQINIIGAYCVSLKRKTTNQMTLFGLCFIQGVEVLLRAHIIKHNTYTNSSSDRYKELDRFKR
jgi:hypothetical protein